jgi:hypothetical protein
MEKSPQKSFWDALEIDYPSSKSFFAACSGVGRQLWAR